MAVNGVSTSGQQVINTTTAMDLVKTTLDNLETQDYSETFAYQRYAVCEGLFQSNRVPVSGGATGRQRRVRLGTEENARGTRLFATGALTVGNVMQTMYEPWVMFEAGMAYEVTEIARNRGAAQIVDLVKTRRSAMWEDICNYFERRGMLGPDSSTDDLNPKGLLFHCRMLNTGVSDPSGGFNGTYGIFQDGTSTQTVAGLDSSNTDFGRLRNWAWTHSGTLDAATLRQLRVAINRVNWRPPKMGKYAGKAKETDYKQFRVYWPQTFGEQYQEIVNAGPDDREGNFSPFWGDLPYGPVETVSTPVLDGVANYPIIGVDHGFTKVYASAGRWMVENDPLTDPTNHRIFNIWYDCDYLIACDEPRRNFVGHTVR